MWSSTELGLKDCGGFIRRRGGIGEVLQLGYLLLPSRVAYRLQGKPARVGGWNTAISGEKDVWKGRSVCATRDEGGWWGGAAVAGIAGSLLQS